MNHTTPEQLAVVLAAGTNGLGAIRSLHEAGVASVSIVKTLSEPAARSRLPREKVLLDTEAPLADALKQALKDLDARREGTNTLPIIPTSDEYVGALDSLKEALPHRYSHNTLPTELSQALIDKRIEVEMIRSFGIDVPRSATRLEGSVHELNEIGYPAIVKPRDYEHYKYFGRKNQILRDEEEAAAFLKEHTGQLDRFIVQEVIPGDDSALWVCNCVFNRKSEVSVAHVFRRLRTSPPHYGVTSYARSESNSSIVDRVAAIGHSLGYVGPAMIEFKRDRRDGSYRYLEINPRVGMCNYFDKCNGVNTAYKTFQLLSDGDVEATPYSQRDGGIYLSFYEDLYGRRLDGEGALGIARDYVRNAWRRHTFAYFCYYDLWPWAHAVREHALDYWRAILKKVRRLPTRLFHR